MGSSNQLILGATIALVGVPAAILAYRKIQCDEKDPSVVVSLPGWAKEYVREQETKEFDSDEDMMQVAIELSKQNVVQNTGGPFGCAIFETDKESGKSKLFAVGCNRVTTLNNSTLHGETVAIQFAQKKLKSFALKDPTGQKEYGLYTSCEPCAMCLGATFWSGVSKMVCAAAKSDAEAIGFDEGPVFPESYEALENAGIRVKKNILRAEGAEILQLYQKTGVIYNGKD